MGFQPLLFNGFVFGQSSGGGGSGTVTSVSLADSTGLFNITGSPVTTSGTLTLASLQSQAQHSVFAGPSGSSGSPTFRLLIASDIPSLAYANQTLSNLTSPVAFNQNLLPGTNNTLTLGDATHRILSLDVTTIANSGSTFINVNNQQLLAVGATLSVDWKNRTLDNSSGIIIVDWQSAILNNSTGAEVVGLDAETLYDSTSTSSVSWDSRQLIASDGTTVKIDWNSDLINDSTNVLSINWDNRRLSDNSAVAALEWGNRILADSSAQLSVDWDNKLLSTNGNQQLDWATIGALFVNNNLISLVADPVNPQDAATKNYVDTHSGTGSVTSVALADSTGIFNISGSPVTTSGTLTLTSLQSKAQNTFLAAPSGSSGAPTFRIIVASDVPTLNQNTTGSAAKWTTARLLAGNSVDGSANVLFANKFIVQGTADAGLSGAQFLGALGTGIVKNTTTTGVLSIAVAGDFPTLNQNTTGTASNITASSNSTLTTLSVLSLPASQLTGTLAAAQEPAHTGDVTNSAGSLVLTLATVNGNVGSFGSSTSIPNFTVNAKGLITAAGSNVVIAPAGTLTGTTLASNVVTSSLTSLGTQASALNMGSHQINSVSDPTSAQDAATKAYVDNVAAGINPAVAVQAATTAAGDTSGFTYNNGVSGIGATLTSNSNNTSLTVDGYTFTAIGQRLLVKNDTQSPSGAFNGIYYVTQVQAALLPLILTRALDYDQPSDINNTGAIPVINGTVNGTTQWVETALVNTVGTDPLSFTKFARNPADYLLKTNNLSDVSSAATSFANITQPASAVLQGSVSTSSQTFAGEKTFNNALVGAQISTPSNPSAGFDKLYFKSDDNLYALNSAGLEQIIGPQGFQGSAWKNDLTFTPNGYGTISNSAFYYRRVGDSMQVRGSFTAGTTSGATTGSISLPGGYAIDNTKLPTSGVQISGMIVGLTSTATTIVANNDTGYFFYDGSDTANVYPAYRTNSNAFEKVPANNIISSNIPVSIEFEIPISGWSVNGNTTILDTNYVYIDTGNGFGSNSGNVIRRFSVTENNVGASITYLDDSVNGATFTITKKGIYSVNYSDTSAGGANIGISLNSAQLTTAILSITDANILATTTVSANATAFCAWTGPLNINDVIRPHTDGNPSGSSVRTRFSIVQIANLS